jgi:hypothetical protein
MRISVHFNKVDASIGGTELVLDAALQAEVFGLHPMR